MPANRLPLLDALGAGLGRDSRLGGQLNLWAQLDPEAFFEGPPAFRDSSKSGVRGPRYLFDCLWGTALVYNTLFAVHFWRTRRVDWALFLTLQRLKQKPQLLLLGFAGAELNLASEKAALDSQARRWVQMSSPEFESRLNQELHDLIDFRNNCLFTTRTKTPASSGLVSIRTLPQPPQAATFSAYKLGASPAALRPEGFVQPMFDEKSLVLLEEKFGKELLGGV